MLWDKGIRQVGDLCNCSLEPPQLYSREDLNRNFNVEIDFLRYKQLKTGIEHGAKSVNNANFDRHLSEYRTPRLPLLLKCSIAVNKGCSFFYATLRSRELQKQTTSTSELKWQAKTGSTFSVRF